MPNHHHRQALPTVSATVLHLALCMPFSMNNSVESDARGFACRALKMDPDGAGSTMELPPPELHEKLTQKVGFSPKQRQAALAYRNHLLSRMGATLRQRRDISLQLLRTLGVQEPSPDKEVTTAASCVRRCALPVSSHQCTA